MFLNEYDMEVLACAFDEHEQPNLTTLIATVAHFKEWVDSVSDGWTYWLPAQKASRQATDCLNLHGLSNHADRPVGDIPDAELTRVLTPIKAFLTRQNVKWAKVLNPEGAS